MNALLDDLIGLGVPGQVVDVSPDGLVATVDVFGVRHSVRLELLERRVGPGDYVLNHVGYAIRRIPDGFIAETLALYEQRMKGVSQEEELIGARED